MTKVEHLSLFPKECDIAQFFGKSYDDAVDLANKSGLPLDYYYEQLHFGKQKSILVCYHKEK